MRILISLLAAVLFSWLLGSCGSSSTPTFCDTTCNNDMLKYSSSHPDSPFVNLSVRNCQPDTIVWSHRKLPTTRKMGFVELVGKEARLHKDFISCYFKDTSYAWLAFNDCNNGRGYLLYLPFDKKESIRKMSSAINSFDKKFVVPEDLRAYADYSTIYVEDINTGKKESMTFKEEYKIDFNNIHQVIDSVNVSHDRIFVQLIKNGEKVPLEKKISL